MTIEPDHIPDPDMNLASPKSDRLDLDEPAAVNRAMIRCLVSAALQNAPMEIYEVVDLLLTGRSMAQACVELNIPRMTCDGRYRKGSKLIVNYLKAYPDVAELFKELGGLLD